jgi:hypothetical protein
MMINDICDAMAAFLMILTIKKNWLNSVANLDPTLNAEESH